MCWGVPAKVLKVEGFKAYVDFGGGVKREALVAVSDLKDGDYVIVHAGIVISKVDREEALKVLEAYMDMAVQQAREDGLNEEEVKQYYKALKSEVFGDIGYE
ncbi:MAG: HypC/HybG/HupF family hydrogenase formation chaperone [Candidatus Bathyarchaeia archaeon]